MLRTAPNFNDIRNRVPAHISSHQTFDIIAINFVGKDKQISPPKKPPCCGEALRVDDRVQESPAVMVFTELRNPTALGSRIFQSRPALFISLFNASDFFFINFLVDLSNQDCFYLFIYLFIFKQVHFPFLDRVRVRMPAQHS